MSIFGKLWDEGKQLAGEGIDDVAKAVGDGLNDVGLHDAAQWVESEGGKANSELSGDAPELQLGQTTDPTQLVHGDLDAIWSAASRLKDFSSAFGDTATGMRSLDTGHWTGAAADAFRGKFAPHPTQWQDASDATSTASGALTSYAAAVESAQDKAGRAIDLYHQGQQATASAVAAYNQQVADYNTAARAYNATLAAGQNPGAKPTEPAAFTDPGTALRDQAQQLLSQARASRNTAASAAASKVTGATSLAPAEPSFWSQVEDDLSDAAQGGVLAGTSLGAGVIDGAAGIVSFARQINPDDPVNQQNPGEYEQGLSGILSGLAHDVSDPESLLKGIVGTGWDSDPFQALGKMVPGIALAAASDGTGAAADAGADAGVSLGEDAGAGAAEDGLGDAAANPTSAAQAPSDMTTAGDPVDVVTGDVVLNQTDVTLPGILPLVLERTHRSSHRAGLWLGNSWMSSFDQRLSVRGKTVTGAFADGRVLTWPRPAPAALMLPVAGPAWPLRAEPDGSWTVTDPQRGLTWHYERRLGYWWQPVDGGHGELPLASITDRAGHQVAFSYHDDGAPRDVTHSGGYRVLVTSGNGRVTGLVLDSPDGDIPLTGYEYDQDGNLAGVVNSSGIPLRFTYDPHGRLTGWTDRTGFSYAYSYDDQGRCVRGDAPGGALSGTFSYVPGSTMWTDVAGAAVVYQIDGTTSRVAAVIDPLGNLTRREHDERGRVTARTDPLGRVTRYAYDGGGNLIAVTRPDASEARASYNEHGCPVQVTAPDGTAWQQEYDERGNRTRLVAPDGTASVFDYDDSGHLIAIAGADGAVTRVTCDGAGLPTVITAPGDRTTRYQRDPFGRVTKVTAPDGNVTALAWTTEGQLAERVLSNGGTERWEYDGEGNLVRHVSPAGAVTRYQRGPFSTLTALTQPDGTVSGFAYDHALRLTEVRHGSLTWRYDLDAAGRLAVETDYNGAVTRYRYDSAGQMTSRVNACGQRLAFGYNLLGNLAWEDADGAASEFGYDAAGRLVSARNDAAEVLLERDAGGRVVAETCNGQATRWEYDAAGRVTRRVTPSGAEAVWSFNPAGQPVAMTVGEHELRFGYDQASRETRRDLPGGTALIQRWDALGRLTGQELAAIPHPASGPGKLPGTGRPEGPADSRSLIARRVYRYHPDGYVTGISDLLVGDRSFTLDPSGRVTEVTGQGWAEHYAYDHAGNLAEAVWPAGAPSTSADWLGADLQGRRQVSGTLITQAGNLRSRHDQAGRLITRQRARISRKPDTWQYHWDARDRLTAVTTPDKSTWHYAYDPFGRRTTKEHLNPYGQSLERTAFTWDGPVLAEQVTTTARAHEVTTWEHRPGTFIPLTQTERTTLRDASQQEIDERFFAIVADLTGAPTELIAADGVLAGYQRHTLWGATVWHPSGATTLLRFPGQYADEETGLHYNYHRYYDPVTASYLTPDPLGLIPAPNPHAYVANPHVLTDPLGLAACGDPLPIHQRLNILYERLGGLPQPTSADEALGQLNDTLNQVEDEFSGVTANPNPGLKFDGRMYPPRDDYIDRLPGGGITARTKGNVIEIQANGGMRILSRGSGDVVYSRGWSDG